MIYGLVANWRQDEKNFPAVFDKAFAFLKANGAASLAVGKHMIDGENLFASVEELRTQNPAERRFESHAKYLDIQVLLSGREKHLYAPDLTGMHVTEDKLAASDLAFHSAPERHSCLVLQPGHYAVYFPGEPHCPCCAVEPGGEIIRKVVFKILWAR